MLYILLNPFNHVLNNSKNTGKYRLYYLSVLNVLI